MPLPSAVAATDSTLPSSPPVGLPSSFPVAPAEAADGRDYPRLEGWPCAVAPYRGWELYEYDEQDGEGFVTPSYFARGAAGDFFLNVSRFRFEPTEARWRWLVDNDFGQLHGRGGPLTDEEIDRAIELDSTAARMADDAEFCASILAGDPRSGMVRIAVALVAMFCTAPLIVAMLSSLRP